MMQSLVFSASGLSFILLAYLVIRCVASPLPVLRSRRRLFPKRPIGVSAVSAGTKTSRFVTTSTERTHAATAGSVARIRAGRADQTKRLPLPGAATILGGYATSFSSSHDRKRDG